MDKFGYIRVAACKPNVTIGNITKNIIEIKNLLSEVSSMGVKIAVFPELSVTGYTCADLFFQNSLIDNTIRGIEDLRKFSETIDVSFAVGAPIAVRDSLYNCAVFIYKGVILGIVPKSYLPNYNEFYECRWFKKGTGVKDTLHFESMEVPFESGKIFNCFNVNIGIEICEDLWVPNPPSTQMALEGADLILNLSATDELAGKHQYLLDLISQQSARCRCGYVYSSAGSGESSSDLAFSGNCIIAENGVILAESKRFQHHSQIEIADIDVQLLRNERRHHNTFGFQYPSPDYKTADEIVPIRSDSDIRQNKESINNYIKEFKYRKVNPLPFVERDEIKLMKRCEEISSIQAWGLAQRLRAINCRNAVIGISGGLDSTLALLVTVKAFDSANLPRKGILGVTMPGFGTTTRTHTNAIKLMECLGISIIEIPIGKAVKQHFLDIGHDGITPDATYENSQARERTQILMDLANKTNGIVIGTGDLSELALGWCTYNGDHMSMYGVNSSIPKTLVRDLVKGYMISFDNDEIKAILSDIIDTPISPELLPATENGEIAQKTEDSIGPYELHDFFLHSMLRYSFSPTKIFMLASKAFEGRYDYNIIKKWLYTFYRRFFSQQFKRSCMPDGVKVGSVCLSPRGDWRMPSDASSAMWLEEIEKL